MNNQASVSVRGRPGREAVKVHVHKYLEGRRQLVIHQNYPIAKQLFSFSKAGNEWQAIQSNVI